MSVPKYYEFYKPILECLSDQKSHTTKEIRTQLIQMLQLSEEDINLLLPSGRQTYLANRIGWASTYLRKAGLIENPAKAVLHITAEGLRVWKENPINLDNTFLRRYESFRTFTNTSTISNNIPDVDERQETPDDIFENAFEKINQNLSDELLNEIMKISPTAFEKMVLDLMAKMGYGTFARMTTAVTGDEGIDGIIMEDKLGFDLIYVQVKQQSEDHPVGRPDVQAFVGAIAGKGGKGLFVTTSKFTRQAIDYAKNQHIILMDGEKLTKYMIEYNFGVSPKKTFEIKAIDSDVFDDYQDI